MKQAYLKGRVEDSHPNYRRSSPSGWQGIQRKKGESIGFSIFLRNHKQAVHNGEFDENCPACIELVRKYGA